MLRHTSISATLLLVMASTAAGQDGDTLTLVRNAMSAAPPSVAKDATIMDGNHRVLRRGTNGWVCMPDNPKTPNNSPMCLDAPWLDLVGALMSKREPPKVTRVGIGYMLQGDMPVSNIDPFAEGPTERNEWVQNSGPHIMVVLPDVRELEGLPTDPKNGGPWVMWKGTPYAHIMIPAVPPGR